MSDELEPVAWLNHYATVEPAPSIEPDEKANRSEPLDRRSDWVEHVRDQLDDLDKSVGDRDRGKQWKAGFISALNEARAELPDVDGKTVEGEQ